MKLSLLALGSSLLVLGCANAPTTAAPVAPEPAPTAAAPAPAEASPPIAEQQSNPMLDEAMRLYAYGDYLGAAKAFQDAYAFEASPSLLLAQAQALRLAGDCDSALPLYERFLDSQTDPTYTNAVRPMMEACLDAGADADAAIAKAE
jgi:tetratricopeptide (TPR) repeat protein